MSIAYHLGEYITELRVRGGSPLVGKSVLESRLGEDHDITVLKVRNAGEDGWAPLRRTLQPDDVLLVRGSLPDIIRLRGTMGLRINADFELRDDTLQSEDLRVVQALVAPGSRLVGHTLKETDFRNRYRALVLGMQRKGEPISDKLSSIKLRLGDALLIQAHEAQIRDLRRGSDLIVLNEVPGSVLRHKAPLAIGILVAVVGLAAFDILPILVAALLGCVALVMTRILQPEDVYRAINWQVIFLLAGVLPLGVAMHTSGAAGWLAEQTVALVGDLGPVAVLAAFYLLTAIMTETMSNAAAAVLLAPIAISTAEQIGVGPPALPDGHHVRRLHRILNPGRLPDQHHDLQCRGIQVHRLPAGRGAAQPHLLGTVGDLHSPSVGVLTQRPPAFPGCQGSAPRSEHQAFGQLDRVQRGALAEVVAHRPQVQPSG